MPIGLGGVEWNFGAKYLGGPAVAKAKQDLILYKAAVEGADAAQEKMEKSARALADAANNQIKIYTQLAKVQKQLDDMIGPRGLSKGGTFGISNVEQIIDVQWKKTYSAVEAGAQRLIEAHDGMAKAYANASKYAQDMTGKIGDARTKGLGAQDMSGMGDARSKGLGVQDFTGKLGDARAGYLSTASAVKEWMGGMEKANQVLDEDIKKQQKKIGVNKDLSASFDLAANAVVAFFTAMGANEIKELIEESTLLAAQVENLGTVLENVGSLAGYTRGGLANLEVQAKRLNITTRAARQGLARLAEGEIDLAENSKLVRIAQDAAVIAGINSSEAYERLVVAIQRTNTWMLRNLGITVNLNNLYREHAISTGRVSTTLSTQEKQQLLLNEVIRKGTLIQGTYESALNDTYKQYTSLDRVVEEAKVQLGEQFLPIFGQIVQNADELITEFREADDGTQALIASFASFVTVGLSATSVVAGLTGGVKLLGMAMGGALGPTLAITGAIAGLAGVYTYLEAKEANRIRRGEELVRKSEAEENAVRRLNVVYEKLATLSVRQENNELTENNFREINDLLGQAVVLLPEYANKLKQLDPKNPREIAIALQEINGVIIQDTPTRLGVLNDELESLKKKAEEARSALSDAGAGFGGVGSEAQVLALDEQIKAIEGRIKALNEFTNEDTAQSFDKLAEEQETAYNQALRVLNAYNTKRINSWEDANLEIALDFEKTLDNLSTSIMTNEQIIKGLKAKSDIRIQQLEDEAEKQLKNAESAAEELKIKDALAAQKASYLQQMGDEADLMEKQIESIKETFAISEKLLEMERQKKLLEMEKDERLNADRRRGKDEGIAQLEADLEYEKRKRLETQKEIQDNLKNVMEEEKELRIKASSTVDEIERQDAEKALDRNKKIQEALQNAETDSARRHAIDLETLERDLADKVKKINEDLLKEKERLLEQELDLKKKLADLDADVAEKMANENIRQQRRALSAARDRISEEEKALSKFENKFKKNYENKLKQIEMQREFGRQLAMGLTPNEARAEVVKKFDIKPDAIQNVLDQIEARREQFEKERDELDKQEKELQRQEEQLHQANLIKQGMEAQEKRQEILDEIKKINEDRKKAEEEAKKAKEGLPPQPKIPDELEEIPDAETQLDASSKAYAKALDEWLKEGQSPEYYKEKSEELKRAEEEYIGAQENANPFRYGDYEPIAPVQPPAKFKPPQGPSYEIPGLDPIIPGSLTSESFNSTGLMNPLVDTQAAANDALAENNRALKESADELEKSLKQQREANLKSAKEAKEQKKRYKRAQEDFAREFASRGL